MRKRHASQYANFGSLLVFTESCNKISGYTSKKLIHKNNRTYLEKNKSFFKYILLFLKKLKTILKYSIV